MKAKFLHKKHHGHQNSVDDCKQYCNKNCKKCTMAMYSEDDEKCHCYETVDEQDDATNIFIDLPRHKKYRVNKIAFWVTFSFFMIFVIILLFFFMKLFVSK